MRQLTRLYKSVNEALAQICLELVIDGESVNVQNAVGDVVLTKDLPDYNVRLAPGYNNIVTLQDRKFPVKGAQAEFLWYMTGKPAVSIVEPFLPNWRKFADDNGNVNSNYGCYWRQYIPGIIEELKRDRYSRRAVMNIFHAGNAPFGKDTPCTLTLQFLIRNNALNLVVQMRSNDVWYGFCIDQFCNSLLHQLVYNSLLDTYPDLKLGWYSHHAGSMHAYLSSSSGNATLTEQILVGMYNAYTQTADDGATLQLPTNITFDNFWSTASECFDSKRFEHFKQFADI